MKVQQGEKNKIVRRHSRIELMSASYNPGWDFQYDPDTVSFFAIAIEVCDATTNYVNDYLDEVGGAFLPGLFWCPWSSKLTKEIKAS